MSRTASTMLDLGTAAPDFKLPEPATGAMVARADFSGQALLVAFICNHCPYVVRIKEGLAAFARDYQARGLAIVAINANDVEHYPDDSPANMVRDVETYGYPFPYLYDENQSVAAAYQAACTPDFFLFDAAHRLAYRGQFDAARPGNDEPVTGRDLRAAADAVLARRAPAPEQVPSLGCNIKWKAGREPSYFGA